MLTSWNIVQDATNLESHLSFSFPGKQRKSSRGGYFSSPALLGAWINLYYFWISVPFIIKSLPLQEFSILCIKTSLGALGHSSPASEGTPSPAGVPHSLPVHFLSIQSSSSIQQTVAKFSIWISDMREEMKWCRCGQVSELSLFRKHKEPNPGLHCKSAVNSLRDFGQAPFYLWTWVSLSKKEAVWTRWT